jgi:4-amino-4-deoxy-L-arabinose transferase-like glycosyltransferase
MNREFFKNSWKYLLILLIASIPLFQHLGSLPLRVWDEARLAINAYEMYHNGNYLVTTFEGEPDFWNTKPPLMIWCQVLSMKIFGVNETGIRVPSALAAFFTCILILLISVRYLKNFWFGFIAVLVLVTSSGYVDDHATRTGDYDALLTFFLTLGCFSFFAFIENSKKKYLYLFFISMTLAVLTKSSAALMILPGLFIYTLVMRKFLFFLRNPHFYIGLSIFLILDVGYYFLREIYNPGYINAVLENEFGGRFLNTIEGHKHDFWYYYQELINIRFKEWVLLIPCGIVIGLLSKDKRIKNLTLFSAIIAVTFFLIISSAQTKCNWYNIPLFPFLSIITSVFICFIFSFLKEEKRLTHYLKYNIIPYVFVFLIFIMPYKQIINKTFVSRDVDWAANFLRTSSYLRDIIKEKRQGDNFTVLTKDYDAHILFYVNILNEKGKNIILKNDRDILKSDKELKTGEIVLTSYDAIKKIIEEKYNFNKIEEYYNITVYEILEEKSESIENNI